MTALPARNERVFRARRWGASACRMSRARVGRAPLLSVTVAKRSAVESRRYVPGAVANAFGRAISA